jgi:dCTP deaminase
MSLLSYDELCGLVNAGFIEGVNPANINAASIDITLDSIILQEECARAGVVDLQNRECIVTRKVDMDVTNGHVMRPGDFLLASTREVFNLPNNIAAEYKLKSSLARCGLNHMLAGWCDPGWYGSKLTLELHNCTQYHLLRLTAGMKIGQMVFWKCDEVHSTVAYGARGQYNNQTCTTASKGLR